MDGTAGNRHGTAQRREPGTRHRLISPLPAPFSWLSPVGPLLFLILVWAGKEFIGERWWLTTWTVYLPQALFLIPSLGLAALALLLRQWRILAGQAAVALLGVGLLFSGAYRLPRPVRRGDLRVMTWNVEGLEGDPRGVLTTIQREAPDVLLLQEVRRARGPDPVPWLRQRLPGWHSVHGADVAIFSPHPLGPARRFALEPTSLERVALQVPAKVRGNSVEIVTVHFNTGLPHPGHERAWNHPRRNMQEAATVRAAQADHLVRIVSEAGRPLVVGGDFNSPPDSYACRWMRASLQSAFAAAGSGFGWSFPSTHPLLRIDHLFASDDLQVLCCRVLPASASDHCPLVADLAWR
jgi:vancomycin resistance protein VanJ